MDATRLRGICEAVIFAAEKPVTMSQLKAIFEQEGEVSKEDLESALETLKADGVEERGTVLVEVSGGFVFRTRPEYREWVSRLTAPKATRLSRASLETLAIVGYRQPVTRAGIDDIRGVDSGAVLKGLLDKKLVKILGKQEGVGNPLIYGTTREFLELFGLKDLSQLPTLKEFQELDDDSRRTLDKHGIELDEPPSDDAIAASEQAADGGSAEAGESSGDEAGEGFERLGAAVALADDAEDHGERRRRSEDEPDAAEDEQHAAKEEE